MKERRRILMMDYNGTMPFGLDETHTSYSDILTTKIERDSFVLRQCEGPLKRAPKEGDTAP
jgi:hypothetical protein